MDESFVLISSQGLIGIFSSRNKLLLFIKNHEFLDQYFIWYILSKDNQIRHKENITNKIIQHSNIC